MNILPQFKLITVVLLSVISLMMIVYSVPATVGAVDSTDQICEGVKAISGQACDTADGSTRLSNAVKVAIRILQLIAGLLSVFYLIYAGIKFITSSGGSDGVKTAKNTILYVAIGIIIVLIAEGIIRFVLVRFG